MTIRVDKSDLEAILARPEASEHESIGLTTIIPLPNGMTMLEELRSTLLAAASHNVSQYACVTCAVKAADHLHTEGPVCGECCAADDKSNSDPLPC